MVCSKCGYTIPKGQTSCVYCGTKAVGNAAQNDASPKRASSAFAKQIRNTPSDGQAVKVSAPEDKHVQQSVQKPADLSLTPKNSPFLSSRQPEASKTSGSANSPFSAQSADAPAAKPQIVAPYAFRPMYSAFDPNSADSPFVRKPLDVQPESKPEAEQVQSEVQKTEEQKTVAEAAEKVSEEVKAESIAIEEPRKKHHGLSITALALAFVTLAVFVFMNL